MLDSRQRDAKEAATDHFLGSAAAETIGIISENVLGWGIGIRGTPAALLFAGGEKEGRKVTYANPINLVLQRYDVTVVGE